MRWVGRILVGVALLGLWPGAGRVFAEDAPNVFITRCRPGPIFVPGRSLGFVALGAPIETVEGRFGRPLAIQNIDVGGRHWLHYLFGAFNVLVQNITIVAVTMPQAASLPVDTDCGTLATVPFSLSVGTATQTYGSPPASQVLNGLRYSLYDSLGLLFAAPSAGSAVQSLTVYAPGQYCSVSPVLASLGRIASGIAQMGGCTPGQ